MKKCSNCKWSGLNFFGQDLLRCKNPETSSDFADFARKGERGCGIKGRLYEKGSIWKLFNKPWILWFCMFLIAPVVLATGAVVFATIFGFIFSLFGIS